MAKNLKGIFVFYTYKNPNTGKEVSDNMPKVDWDYIQNSGDKNRRKCFTYVREVDVNNTAPVADTETAGGVPVEEDVLECPLCGWVAEDEEKLQYHKEIGHGKEE